MARSGEYVRQVEGYDAFMPSRLPPDPDIIIDGEMQRLLSAADRALGRLDGSIQTLPNPEPTIPTSHKSLQAPTESFILGNGVLKVEMIGWVITFSTS